MFQGPKNNNNRSRRGVVLLVTLIMLVVLATLGYTLTGRIADRRHRNHFTIDYCKARYGCDSGLKYAFATMEELDPKLISRPNDPDFSDLFNMTEAEYEELLEKWAAEKALEADQSAEPEPDALDLEMLRTILDINDINDFNDLAASGEYDQQTLQIPGPYGPPWPFVSEPVEFEIGAVKIKIEVEDENAKYPVGWALTDNKDISAETDAGLTTFCEWARMEPDEIDALKEQLKQISEIKRFKVDFKPITKIERTSVPAPPTSATRTSSSSLRRTPRTRITRKTISVEEQIAEQTRHFARLLHSSLLDSEALARPRIHDADRRESPLKYMATWGSTKVNINTAPRHVLEAAFAFGGDADRIAHEVIRLRKTKPIQNIEELKTQLLGYSNAIEKCENYITTASTFFTIKVTAVSGVAKASSVVAITKNGNRVQRVALINS